MKQKLYLVVSIRELRHLTAAAEEHIQAKRGTVPETACVILDLEADPEFTSEEGRVQITTAILHDCLRS